MNATRKIYADYNASTPLHPQVIKYLKERLDLDLWANPNSHHKMGKMLLDGINRCRTICADSLAADTDSIIFTSGASEGISTIFHVICGNRDSNKDILLISSIEHPAVSESANYYKKFGYKVIKWPVNHHGEIDLNFIKSDLDNFKERVAMVAIMAANNESGVIQPIEEVGLYCERYSIPFFSDTTQLIAKEEFNFNKSAMDFAVISAHKFSGPIGVGAILYKHHKPHLKKILKENALILGGGQQEGLRSGTQNYLGIECMSVALRASIEDYKESKKLLHKYRMRFENDLCAQFKNLIILGSGASRRLPQTTLLSYPGIYGPIIQQQLDSQNIFVSTSAACSDHSNSNHQQKSAGIAQLMGYSEDVARGMIRVSLGGLDIVDNSEEIYKLLHLKFSQAILKLAKVGEW
ncbi:MAG: aminotransferase class V-fold PLP-dependent enzyme [Oligoflexia bacterium]|nr:aminotransferase class V-fold PLP-dependent enzyme [Oligoflexia bacterium]